MRGGGKIRNAVATDHDNAITVAARQDNITEEYFFSGVKNYVELPR